MIINFAYKFKALGTRRQQILKWNNNMIYTRETNIRVEFL